MKSTGSLRRIVRGYGLLVLFMAIVAGSAGAQGATASAAPSPDTVIVPGKAIGPWTLDMTFTDLLWQLGPRAVTLSGPGPQFHTDLEMSTWASPPLVAFHSPADDTVSALGIADPGYVTRERIGVGASEEQVVAAYGVASAVIQPPARSKILIYDARGLAFQVAFNGVSGGYGKVERTFVFRPGRARAIWQTR